MARSLVVFALVAAACFLAAAGYLAFGTQRVVLQGVARVRCRDLACAELAAGIDRELALSCGYRLHVKTFRPVTELDGRVVVAAPLELHGSRPNWEAIKNRGQPLQIRGEIEAAVEELINSTGAEDPRVEEFALDVTY